MYVTKPIDIPLLTQELAAAGIDVPNGISSSGWPPETPYHQEIYTTDGQGHPQELPPGSEAVVEAHDASRPKRLDAFESQEDAERLLRVRERAETDPAFAALAELTLGKQGS